LQADDAVTGQAAVIRRMSISRSEFFRTLPDALGTSSLVVTSDQVTLETPGRRLAVLFREEPPHRIASLTLPFAHVELCFEGYDEREMAAAVDRFDLYFRRGGG
jgi:hypothetical protein